jgi:hypothetical protein
VPVTLGRCLAELFVVVAVSAQAHAQQGGGKDHHDYGDKTDHQQDHHTIQTRHGTWWR